jgi:hypothetical protein
MHMFASGWLYIPGSYNNLVPILVLTPYGAVVHIIHMNKIYLDNPGKKHLYQVIFSTIKNSTNFCTNSPSCQ